MAEKQLPRIKSITLTIGKKEIELSPEECKELKLALEEMYPAPEKIVSHEHHYRDWWYYPHWPYYGLNIGGAALGAGNFSSTADTKYGNAADKMQQLLADKSVTTCQIGLKANY